MSVDSYRWLPGSLVAYYQALPIEAPDPPPFTPFDGEISDATVALITTAGIYVDEPFDMDRERREPIWGDPSFREIPADVTQDQIGVSHLHYNNDPVRQDVNVVFPIDRVRDMVGALAPTHYSFMGFQLDQSEQLGTYVPQVIERLKKETVDAVFLTPA